jgi:hypothetical protein
VNTPSASAAGTSVVTTFIAFAKALGLDGLTLDEITANNTGTFSATAVTIP